MLQIVIDYHKRVHHPQAWNGESMKDFLVQYHFSENKKKRGRQKAEPVQQPKPKKRRPTGNLLNEAMDVQNMRFTKRNMSLSIVPRKLKQNKENIESQSSFKLTPDEEDRLRKLYKLPDETSLDSVIDNLIPNRANFEHDVIRDILFNRVDANVPEEFSDAMVIDKTVVLDSNPELAEHPYLKSHMASANEGALGQIALGEHRNTLKRPQSTIRKEFPQWNQDAETNAALYAHYVSKDDPTLDLSNIEMMEMAHEKASDNVNGIIKINNQGERQRASLIEKYVQQYPMSQQPMHVNVFPKEILLGSRTGAKADYTSRPTGGEEDEDDLVKELESSISSQFAAESRDSVVVDEDLIDLYSKGSTITFYNIPRRDDAELEYPTVGSGEPERQETNVLKQPHAYGNDVEDVLQTRTTLMMQHAGSAVRPESEKERQELVEHQLKEAWLSGGGEQKAAPTELQSNTKALKKELKKKPERMSPEKLQLLVDSSDENAKKISMECSNAMRLLNKAHRTQTNQEEPLLTAYVGIIRSSLRLTGCAVYLGEYLNNMPTQSQRISTMRDMDQAISDTQIWVSREVDEMNLREPEEGEEPCIMGAQCQGRFIPNSVPITLVGFVSDKEIAEHAGNPTKSQFSPTKNRVCVMCYRHLVHTTSLVVHPQETITNITVSKYYCEADKYGEYALSQCIVSGKKSHTMVQRAVPIHCRMWYTQIEFPSENGKKVKYGYAQTGYIRPTVQTQEYEIQGGF